MAAKEIMLTQRFDFSQKGLKCRMIVMALHRIAHPNVTLDMFPESHGEVKEYMRSTLKHIDPLYEMALASLNS